MAKRENKKVNKTNLIEVTGNREELAQYLGETFKVEALVTNTYGYLREKRLITELKKKDY